MFLLDKTAFLNTNVNEKVFIFNKTIFLSLVCNLVPQKTIVGDKDSNGLKKIKNFIQEKNNAFDYTVHCSSTVNKINLNKSSD